MAYKIFYNIFLYPYLLSPLRHIPGPPVGNPLTGQMLKVVKGEAGIPQREWAKQYGPLVRVVGPIGIERLIPLEPSKLKTILVNQWVDYPRVNPPRFCKSAARVC